MRSDGRPELTAARFDAALAARGLSPGETDRQAAFTIARFLDDCVDLLHSADPEGKATGSDDGT